MSVNRGAPNSAKALRQAGAGGSRQGNELERVTQQKRTKSKQQAQKAVIRALALT